MKKKLLIIALFFSLNVFSQNFEGKIVYKNICKSKSPEWTIEYCQMITDSVENFYYKNGNFKYKVPNNETWTIYRQVENKMYRKNKNSNSVFWNKVDINNDTILKYKINKKVIKVLGYDCDELIVQTKGGTQKYYYNSSLSIDPKFYKNHLSGNLYNITSLTKSITLKTIFILETQGLILESTAIKINSKVCSEDIFNIPSDLKLVKGEF